MSYKQNRTLKVYEQNGYKYKTIPTIMLKGQWLAELNFQLAITSLSAVRRGSW